MCDSSTKQAILILCTSLDVSNDLKWHCLLAQDADEDDRKQLGIRASDPLGDTIDVLA